MTHREHDAAMKEIEALAKKDPQPNTPEGKRLVELATEMEAFEKPTQVEIASETMEGALASLRGRYRGIEEGRWMVMFLGMTFGQTATSRSVPRFSFAVGPLPLEEDAGQVQ